MNVTVICTAAAVSYCTERGLLAVLLYWTVVVPSSSPAAARSSSSFHFGLQRLNSTTPLRRTNRHTATQAKPPTLRTDCQSHYGLSSGSSTIVILPFLSLSLPSLFSQQPLPSKRAWRRPLSLLQQRLLSRVIDRSDSPLHQPPALTLDLVPPVPSTRVLCVGVSVLVAAVVGRRAMKLVYVGLYRVAASGSSAWRLASASHLVDFGYFTRSTIAQHIQFAARTCVQRTQAGCRQTIQLDEQTPFVAHTFVRGDGLAGVVMADKEYPVRVAFTLLTKQMAAYEERVGVNWKKMEQDQDSEPDFLKQDILHYQVSGTATLHHTTTSTATARSEHSHTCTSERRAELTTCLAVLRACLLLAGPSQGRQADCHTDSAGRGEGRDAHQHRAAHAARRDARLAHGQVRGSEPGQCAVLQAGQESQFVLQILTPLFGTVWAVCHTNCMCIASCMID